MKSSKDQHSLIIRDLIKKFYQYSTIQHDRSDDHVVGAMFEENGIYKRNGKTYEGRKAIDDYFSKAIPKRSDFKTLTNVIGMAHHEIPKHSEQIDHQLFHVHTYGIEIKEQSPHDKIEVTPFYDSFVFIRSPPNPSDASHTIRFLSIIRQSFESFLDDKHEKEVAKKDIPVIPPQGPEMFQTTQPGMPEGYHSQSISSYPHQNITTQTNPSVLDAAFVGFHSSPTIHPTHDMGGISPMGYAQPSSYSHNPSEPDGLMRTPSSGYPPSMMTMAGPSREMTPSDSYYSHHHSPMGRRSDTSYKSSHQSSYSSRQRGSRRGRGRGSSHRPRSDRGSSQRTSYHQQSGGRRDSFSRYGFIKDSSKFEVSTSVGGTYFELSASIPDQSKSALVRHCNSVGEKYGIQFKMAEKQCKEAIDDTTKMDQDLTHCSYVYGTFDVDPFSKKEFMDELQKIPLTSDPSDTTVLKIFVKEM
ncbi:hypothetical protein ADUPG1_011172 [Aduncisulcus paluster]|uniref:Uncharacterized protein n=1 Tax=Aduncisulcus paluster TaxID=2918883 RepID=A0ABQ5JZN2_9EUKA|nr:hypothetical protein ADUPG1_011172 [Aduncisulcus paluster]